jgi:hypothetical protein
MAALGRRTSRIAVFGFRIAQSEVIVATSVGKGIEVRAAPVDRSSEVLSPDALAFVADLARTF